MKSVLIVIFIETTNMDKKVEIELSVLFWLLTEFEAHFDNLTSVSSTPLLDSSPDIPWACDPYNGQLMYAFLYGITSAAYVLLTTLVLADLLGADKFTNAFGLLSSGVLMKIPEIAVKLLKFQDQKEKERNSTFVPKERGSYLDDPTYDWTDYIDWPLVSFISTHAEWIIGLKQRYIHQTQQPHQP